ncbi:MAG: hypothetical protein F6K40_12035 [Okeania sp. SIO3I5]|uniref:hypothetical protein n=1 Tax=Okeania sp. SIO3I5 TaxID=2607805 RepID=UPI0013B94F55|nr:hypothetical protein [Okeania sp. SIO3I5]NEQ36961.1 hypothetical protein [Okeania sp. SIO3I5]
MYLAFSNIVLTQDLCKISNHTLSVVASRDSPLQDSGATPRRRFAVRPRDDDSRKGMRTKRGNAGQERERAPRDGGCA